MMHVLFASIIYPCGAEILQLIDVPYVVIKYPSSVDTMCYIYMSVQILLWSCLLL